MTRSSDRISSCLAASYSSRALRLTYHPSTFTLVVLRATSERGACSIFFRIQNEKKTQISRSGLITLRSVFDCPEHHIPEYHIFAFAPVVLRSASDKAPFLFPFRIQKEIPRSLRSCLISPRSVFLLQNATIHLPSLYFHSGGSPLRTNAAPFLLSFRVQKKKPNSFHASQRLTLAERVLYIPSCVQIRKTRSQFGSSHFQAWHLFYFLFTYKKKRTQIS